MVDQLKMILNKIILNQIFLLPSYYSLVIRLLRRQDIGLRLRITLLTSIIRDKRDLLNNNSIK